MMVASHVGSVQYSYRKQRRNQAVQAFCLHSGRSIAAVVADGADGGSARSESDQVRTSAVTLALCLRYYPSRVCLDEVRNFQAESFL